MSSVTMVLLLGAAYLLMRRPREAASTAPPPAAGATITPSGTQITIPGIGTYTNIGGGQVVSITLDPNLLSGLFGGGAAPPTDVATVLAPADVGLLPQPTAWWG